MNLYEHTIVIKQDVSTAQIKKLTEKYSKIVENNDGSIVKTGGIDLVNILEDKGYKWIKKDSN